MMQFVRAVALVLGCTGPVLAGNWPAWRGPNGDGHSPEKDLQAGFQRALEPDNGMQDGPS